MRIGRFAGCFDSPHVDLDVAEDLPSGFYLLSVSADDGTSVDSGASFDVSISVPEPRPTVLTAAALVTLLAVSRYRNRRSCRLTEFNES